MPRVLPEQPDAARGGALQPLGALQCGGLAGPVGPEQGGDFPVLRGQAQPAHGPDGLTLDGQGRPVVPLNVPGQVVRLDPGGICQLAGGLMFTSAVTYGRGAAGFSAGRLFAVGFTGTVHEIIGG